MLLFEQDLKNHPDFYSQDVQYSSNDLSFYIINNLKNVKHHQKGFSADCPFCGSPQKKRKFNVNLSTSSGKSKTGVFNCYKCGNKGTGWSLAKFLGWKGFSDNYEINLPSVNIQPFLELKQDKEKPLKPLKKPPRFIYNHPDTKEIIYGKDLILGEWNPEKRKCSKATPWCQFIDGKWYWGLNHYTGPKFLYNLQNWKYAEFIYICEGEKKALFLQKILPQSHLAVALYNGANTNIDPANLPYLKNKKVFILSDIDTKHRKGQEASQRAYNFLKKNNIDAHIIDVCMDSRPTFSGYDIEDYIFDGHNYDDFKKLVTIANDETDQKFLEKYIYGLREISENYFQFEDRFVNNKLSPETFSKKGNAIKSLQGTGKTQLMGEIIYEAKSRNIRIIYLVHRQSLAHQASKRLGIPCYLDEEINHLFITHSNRFDYSGDIVCSADSCCKLNLEKYHDSKFIVIIDEVDQYFEHYIKGSTCKKNRKEIAAVHRFLFQHASKLFCLSADVPPWVFDVIRDELGVSDIAYFENKWKNPEIKFINHERTDFSNIINLPGTQPANEIIRLMKNDLKKGKRVSLASATKDFLKMIKIEIELLFKDKKILIIDDDNSQSKEVTAIKNDPTKLLNYDFVGYSPTLFSGIDFNILFSENHYLVSVNGPLNAFELLQGAMRFRQAKIIHYYISHNTGSRPTEPERIYQDFKKTENIYYETKNLNIENGKMEIDDRYRNLVDSYCKIQAYHNQSVNMLRSNFRRLVKEKGFTHVNTSYENDEKEKFANEMAQVYNEMKMVRKIKKEKTVSGLKSAPEISYDEYCGLNEGKCENDEDIFKKTSYEFVEINGNSTEAIDRVYEEFCSHKPRLLEKKIDSYKRAFYLTDKDNFEDDKKAENNLIYDRPNFMEKAQVTREIMDFLGLFNGTYIGKAEKLKLARFLKVNESEIGRVLGLQIINKIQWIPDDKTLELIQMTEEQGKELDEKLQKAKKAFNDAEKKAAYWLRGFVQSLGLKLKKTGKSGNLRYYLDDNRRQMIEEIIERQNREVDGWGQMDCLIQYKNPYVPCEEQGSLFSI